MLFLLSLIVTKHEVESVTVTEVTAGHLAELPCLSSDDHHRFMFWQLKDDKNVIGPGNSLDQEKYNYEVLTGKLFIRVSQLSQNQNKFELIRSNAIIFIFRESLQLNRVFTNAFLEASKIIRPSIYAQ